MKSKWSRYEYHLIQARIKLIREGIIKPYLIPKEPAKEASINFRNYIKDVINDNPKAL